MSDYAAWRISYQTSEQAAKAAYEQTQEQKARIAQLEAQLAAARQGVQQEGERSATYGMNIAKRILHVGGRENAQTYIEFGSVDAVRALVGQVLRDLPNGCPDFPAAHPTTQGVGALDSKLSDEAKSAAMLLCAEAAALCGNQIEQGCVRCDAVTVLAAHHDFSNDEFNHLFLNANLGKKDSYRPKFFSINVFDELAAQAKQEGASHG